MFLQVALLFDSSACLEFVITLLKIRDPNIFSWYFVGSSFSEAFLDPLLPSHGKYCITVCHDGGNVITMSIIVHWNGWKLVCAFMSMCHSWGIGMLMVQWHICVCVGQLWEVLVWRKVQILCCSWASSEAHLLGLCLLHPCCWKKICLFSWGLCVAAFVHNLLCTVSTSKNSVWTHYQEKRSALALEKCKKLITCWV